ncbi:MAG: hypothetical protein Q7T82_21045 [Armatimonadota bacterium]|nr:hypothetical protein [Armatimonadota bacterium]
MRQSCSVSVRGGASVLQRIGLAFVVAIILAAILASVTTPREVQSTIVAKSGDLNLRLTLITQGGAITMGEPLIARIDLTNSSGDAVEVNLGNNLNPGTCLEILDDKGELLASTPRPEPHVEGMKMIRTLEPAQVYSQHWVVSALYQFKRPGVYTVRVRQLRFADALPVLAEDEAQLRVLPFNRTLLEARCDVIFREMRGLTKGQKLPLSAYTKALYSVRDEAALPHLEWMGREWEDKHAFIALRRIGTKRATDILSRLSSRQDGAGKAARRALEKPLDKTDIMWEMNYY